MRRITSIGLCAGLALLLSILGAQSALARGKGAARARTHANTGSVLVLKAGGQIVPNGALVHVTAPNYFLKTKVTVEGTSKKAAKEEEVECSTEYFEQGKIVRNFAANSWSVVETAGVDFCEGEEWFGGHAMEHPITLIGPNTVVDNSPVELFRTEEQIKEEEKTELSKEEPIHAREPKRCVYHTIVGHGRFRSKKGGPLEAKIRGKMLLVPSMSGPGCGEKAKWKGTFTMTYKGVPITSSLEAGPSVAGVSPGEGPEGGGTSVTISGNGFGGATAVQFGSNAATSFKVNSNNSITATAPAGSGAVDVRVTTPIGITPVSGADKFEYAQRPTVTEISPKAGAESGGTSVTITGAHFTSGSTVHFGSASATMVKVNSSVSITAVSPPGAGTLNVIVTNTGGTSMTSAADKFTYVPSASVTSISPKEGPEAGGTTVTISGTHFKEVSAVKFGSNNAAKFKVNSESSIEAESPAGTGTVHVTVTTSAGTTATSSADEFTYIVGPGVSEISPKAGPEAGATNVTVTGKGFKEVSAVKFGATNATKFKVNSETSLEAESPTGTGAVHVTVTTPGGTSATSAADEFTYDPVPSVSEVSPKEGPQAGATNVTITGTGFKEVSAVKFGSSNATKVKVNSETSIEAESPSGTGAVNITVSTPGGTSATSAADEFSYAPVPTVTKINPTEGPEAGGTVVTVEGTSFKGVTAVKFGATEALKFKVNSETSLEAESPAGTGTVNLTVTAAGGTSATGAADEFKY